MGKVKKVALESLGITRNLDEYYLINTETGERVENDCLTESFQSQTRFKLICDRDKLGEELVKEEIIHSHEKIFIISHPTGDVSITIEPGMKMGYIKRIALETLGILGESMDFELINAETGEIVEEDCLVEKYRNQMEFKLIASIIKG